MRSSLFYISILFLFFFALESCQSAQATADDKTYKTYQDLTELFKEWRTFETPPLKDGAPDYTAATFEKRLPEFKALQAKDIAEIIYFAVSRPPHVNIADLLVFPTAQANSVTVNKTL